MKTNDPKVSFKKKEIKIKSISTNLPLKNLFSKNINFEEIKILTHKNKIKNVVDFVRAYQNNPQLFILSKVVKDGTISIESKIKFNQDGSIKKNYLIDGNIENFIAKGLVKNLEAQLINDFHFKDINLNFFADKNDILLKNIFGILEEITVDGKVIVKIKNKLNSFFMNDIKYLF